MNPLTLIQARHLFIRTLCFVCGFLLVSAGATKAQLILADTFNYPDGFIDNTPGSPWSVNYAPSNRMFVVSGRLFLSETNQESIRCDFPNSYNDGALYARMVVNVSKLPSGNGSIFACFRQSFTDSLWARVWVLPSVFDSGKFWFGVTVAGSSVIHSITRDLSLGTNYTLVVRYAVTNNYSTLWLNPTDESDTNNMVQDLNTFGSIPIQHFAFTQAVPFTSGNIGNLTVDDVRIGRSFAEVMPQVVFTSISNAPGGTVTLRASGQATTNYIFQANTNLLSTNWVNLSTNNSGTNGNFNLSDPGATNFPSRFYRLLKQ